MFSPTEKSEAISIAKSTAALYKHVISGNMFWHQEPAVASSFRFNNNAITFDNAATHLSTGQSILLTWHGSQQWRVSDSQAAAHFV